MLRRKLFLVLLGNDKHGKGHIIRPLVTLMEPHLEKPPKGRRRLQLRPGCLVDSYIFIRSYQEYEQPDYGDDIGRCLDANDADWRQRDLLLMPSHIELNHLGAMIDIAHAAGFSAVVAYILMSHGEIANYGGALQLNWDERWEIWNFTNQNFWEVQCSSIGNSLMWRIFRWICS